MPLLSLRNISKNFGSTLAVVDVALNVEHGEFFGLLGPSGCGKTTTLRMIAGLEKPDSGTIEFSGADITDLPPERRGFGMVFQNYALFPHLNVFENVAFGLRARHKGNTEISERVASALELVQLPSYDKRRVDELSGGQQQRVAIARAIAIEPALLLFDEPLSNLDVALREETRRELRMLVKRLNLTAVYVTHDQEEAFALCDRIAVMSAGNVQQIGAASELYDHPANAFVAGFLGNNNLIRATRLTSSNDPVTKFRTLEGGHTLTVRASHEQLMNLPVNKACLLTIRPEAIALKDKHGTDNQLAVRIEHIEFGGATTTLSLNANGLKLEMLVLRADEVVVGDEYLVTMSADQIRLLPQV